jgi:hypothetical protein
MDITDRKADAGCAGPKRTTEDSRMPLEIIRITPAGSVTANPAAARMLGFDSPEE